MTGSILSDEEIDTTWKIRWEIEKLYRDVKTLCIQDSSFLKEEETSKLSPSL